MASLAALKKKYDLPDELHEELERLRIIEDTSALTKQTLKETNVRLNERIKELDCLLSISDIISNKALNYEVSLQKIAEIIPHGWQCPEDCSSCIKIQDLQFNCGDYENATMKLDENILHQSNVIGSVGVGYENPYNKNGFLDEEKKLLKGIARKLGWFYDMHTTHNKLQESETLHRITLSNISDAVIIAKNSGEIVYLCPSINSIFGCNTKDFENVTNLSQLLKVDKTIMQNIEFGQEYKNIEIPVLDTKEKEHFLLVNLKGVKIADGNVLITCRDITERKKREKALEEKTIAMKQILSHIEDEKHDLRKEIEKHLEQNILPSFNNLIAIAGPDIKDKLQQIHENLNNIASPSTKIASLYANLTPREIEICNLIKEGATSKDIAYSLGISHKTVHKHRQIIRKKLNLTNRKINLVAFLRSYA